MRGTDSQAPRAAATEGADRVGELATETISSELAELDLLELDDLVALLCSQVHRVPAGVLAAVPHIAEAVERIVERLERGGRLVYVGAGTAGRLGVLDAAEARPSFNLASGTVLGILAGHDSAAAGTTEEDGEEAEDDEEAGAAALRSIALGPNDTVVGISASGRTPYVLGAIAQANTAGALSICLVCNTDTPLAEAADLAVEVVTGHEVIAGSTRLNAGTAQKVVLNVISTAAMVRLGKTYGNLMVELRPTNKKLRDRAERIVSAIAGCTRTEARAALESSSWEPKIAVTMLVGGVGATEARRMLDEKRGRLRETLTSLPTKKGDAGTGAAGSPHRIQTSTWSRLGVRAAVIEGELVPGDVAVAHGEVIAVGLARAGAASALAVPGFVDAQVNGYAGVDVLGAEPDELVKMGEALLADGVFGYQPTLITSDIADVVAAMRRIARLVGMAGRHADVLGIHLEGPFLSRTRSGTHPLHHLRDPDLGLLERLMAEGHVKTLTVAPELPGAMDIVATCVRRGVVVSLGHSAASAAQASAAFAAGASAVTHLFNAMNPMSARSPGLAGAALASPGVTLQLIGDGVHVASEMLRLAFSSVPARCTLVSDALAAAALGDGPVLLGEVPVEVHGGVARRGDGTIAGSTARLADGLANLVRIGIALPDAVEAVTRRPARLLGDPSQGRLRPGHPADLVVLDEDITIARVIKGGVEVGRR